MINRTDKRDVTIHIEISKETAEAVAEFYRNALCVHDSDAVKIHILREFAFWAAHGYDLTGYGNDILCDHGNNYEVKFELKEEK